MGEFYIDRIQTACYFRGWTWTELAARANISDKSLRLLRTGVAPFTSEYAEKLSRAFNLPLSFFILHDEIAPETQLTFRTPQRSSKVRKRQVATEYSLLSATVQRVAKMAYVEKKNLWLNAVAPINNPTYAEIERIAQEARLVLGVEKNGPVPNVTRAFERGGISIAPLHENKNDPEIMDGVSNPQLTLPVIGYLKHKESGDRQRFTIAHEAGHIILQKNRKLLSKKVQEEEANYFASAFLFPEEDARHIFTPSMDLMDYVRLKATWGVSIAAMITRASRLGIINQERQRSLMVQLSARHWRKSEPVHVEQEKPILLKQMVGSSLGTIIDATHVEASAISIESFLGLPFNLFSDWCQGLVKTDNFDL